MSSRPLKNAEVSAVSRLRACFATPRTVFGTRPQQNFEIPRTDGLVTSSVVPGAVVSPRPLKNAQTAPYRRRFAKHFAPAKILAGCPLDHVELPTGGRLEATFRGQRAAAQVITLENLNAAVFGDELA